MYPIQPVSMGHTIVVICILLIILPKFVYWLAWWIDESYGGYDYPTDKAYGYNTGNNTNKPTTITTKAKAAATKVVNNWNNDRTCPPRAEFFGRLEGELVDDVGLYEEIYLNTWESTAWKAQKALKPELEPLCTTKINKLEVGAPLLQQNAEKSVKIT